MRRFFLIGAMAIPLLMSGQPLVKGMTGESRSLRLPEISSIPGIAFPNKVMRPDAMANAPEYPSEIITEAQGETKTYIRSGFGYQMELDFDVEFISGKFVFGADNKVYIHNPISFLPSDSYMVGEMIDGETIKVGFPQIIYSESYDGETYDYYVNKMNFIYDNEEEQTGWYFVDADDNTLSYKLVDDNWELQGTDMARSVLGLTDVDGSWMGYADFMTVFKPYEVTTVTLPAGVETAPWAMTFDDIDGRFVEVGFDNDDVYLQGFTTYLPDAWIKGRVENGKIIFPSKQYVGIDYITNHYDYFFGADWEYVEVVNDDQTFYDLEVTLTDEMEFTFDSDAKVMKSEQAMILNTNNEYRAYMDGILSPKIALQPQDISLVPMNPSINYYVPYNMEIGFGMLAFMVPKVNNEGELLDSKNLYYRIYLDDEVMIFYNDEFVCFDDDTTDIPFEFLDEMEGMIYNNGVEHGVILVSEGYDRIGVQSVYKTTDGKEYCSEIVYDSESGIHGVSDEVDGNGVVGIEYFSVTGQKLSNPAEGIVIVRKSMVDGSVKCTKVVIK